MLQLHAFMTDLNLSHELGPESTSSIEKMIKHTFAIFKILIFKYEDLIPPILCRRIRIENRPPNVDMLPAWIAIHLAHATGNSIKIAIYFYYL